MKPEREKEIRAVAKTFAGHGDFASQAMPELLAALDECRREREEYVRRLQADPASEVECLREAIMEENAKATRYASRLVRVESDPFLRFKDSIEQTLVYVSNHIGDPEYAERIRGEVDGLLAKLGVE